MHAIVLAAGFGTRMEVLTPKPLLPLGRGVVLDQVVKSVWVPGISAVQVIHNQAVIPGPRVGRAGTRPIYDWAEQFKLWKKGHRWEHEPGRNLEPPYIRLFPNGIQVEADRRGAVGDLAFFVRRMKRRDEPILVVCADDLFVHPELPALLKYGTSVVTCRSVESLEDPVLSTDPSKVRIEAGMAVEVGPVAGIPTPWRFCGPFLLHPRDFPFLETYVELCGKAGILPDSIGDFLDSMINDDRSLAAHRTRQRFGSAGTQEAYEHAKSRWLGGRGADPVGDQLRLAARVDTRDAAPIQGVSL